MPYLSGIAEKGGLNEYHGRLVRVRMLVVETLDPEVYPGAVCQADGAWACGKYGNNLSLTSSSSAPRFWERRPVRVIPVPGQAVWCGSVGHAPGAPRCLC